MNIKAVVGLNYGDEGKGLVTDYLASRCTGRTAVVRFNGGAQAGHTVVLPDGTRNVFHSVGSGTFAGADTILSSFFVVNPVLMVRELEELRAKNLGPNKIYIDTNCPVTTPYDVFINQLLETTRGSKRHGSVGVGFGETLQRHENGYELTFNDVITGAYHSKLFRIMNEYLPARLDELDLKATSLSILQQADLRFSEDCRILLDAWEIDSFNPALISGPYAEYDNLIFEGAQGLNLDQYGNDYPYVTRSNTGLKNVDKLYFDWLLTDPLDIFYVTRSYITRHGAGPLLNESNYVIDMEDQTNHYHRFQGFLRYAPLDFLRMRQEVAKDIDECGIKDININGVMTWCNNNNFDVSKEFERCLGTDQIYRSMKADRNGMVKPKNEKQNSLSDCFSESSTT